MTRWRLWVNDELLAEWDGDLLREALPVAAIHHCVTVPADYEVVRRQGSPFTWYSGGRCRLELVPSTSREITDGFH